MQAMEEVIVVDTQDNPTGTAEKMAAHKEGLLHRAISVIIFNSKNELLIQKRAINKYHSGGLWTNTCCSHPKPNENTQQAAERRLMEEMGIRAPLKWAFSFHYKVDFENGLTENELDHVWVGISDQIPSPHPEEASDYKYVSVDWLVQDMKENPDHYTHWFHIIMRNLPKFYTK